MTAFEVNHNRIHEAAQNTSEMFPGYLEEHLQLHCEGGKGSVFYTNGRPCKDAEEVFGLIASLKWREVHPEDAAPGCAYFRAVTVSPLGELGIAKLGSLHADSIVAVSPIHGDETHMELTVKGDGVPTVFATVILGTENGKEVLVTAFPGELVPPSTLTAEQLHPGSYTVAELRDKVDFTNTYVKLVK